MQSRRGAHTCCGLARALAPQGRQVSGRCAARLRTAPRRRLVRAVVPTASPRRGHIGAVVALPPPGRRLVRAVVPLPLPGRRLVWAVVPLRPPRRGLVWAAMPLETARRRLVWAVMPLAPARRGLVRAVMPLLSPWRGLVWAVIPLAPARRRGIRACALARPAAGTCSTGVLPHFLPAQRGKAGPLLHFAERFLSLSNCGVTQRSLGGQQAETRGQRTRQQQQTGGHGAYPRRQPRDQLSLAWVGNDRHICDSTLVEHRQSSQ